MSEEEKKAIETLKGLTVYYDDYSLLDEEEIEENDNINKSIQLMIDSIEKQQKELNNLKEIEKSHKEENGKLRVELEQYKGLNEALERSSEHVTQLTAENSDLKYQLYHKQQMIDELTQNEENLKIELGKEKEKNKEYEKQLDLDYVDKNYISKDKIKEIGDENIPKQPNIITGEMEYTPNTNANSFLVQDILKLLEEK